MVKLFTLASTAAALLITPTTAASTSDSSTSQSQRQLRGPASSTLSLEECVLTKSLYCFENSVADSQEACDTLASEWCSATSGGASDMEHPVDDDDCEDLKSRYCMDHGLGESQGKCNSMAANWCNQSRTRRGRNLVVVVGDKSEGGDISLASPTYCLEKKTEYCLDEGLHSTREECSELAGHWCASPETCADKKAKDCMDRSLKSAQECEDAGTMWCTELSLGCLDKAVDYCSTYHKENSPEECVLLGLKWCE